MVDELICVYFVVLIRGVDLVLFVRLIFVLFFNKEVNVLILLMWIVWLIGVIFFWFNVFIFILVVKFLFEK